MLNKYIFIFLLCFYFCECFSQDVKKVSIEYTYYSTNKQESIQEAENTALYNAKLKAIADHFGTIIAQTNRSVINNSNSKSSVNFVSYSESDVCGEWIETIGEPVYKRTVSDDGMLVVTVSVKGRIREFSSSSIEVEAHLLYNGTDKNKDKIRNSTYMHGDTLYLYFKAPVDGYLAFYNEDNEVGIVQCLLPYPSQKMGACKVEANKEYIFFSENKKDDPLAEGRGVWTLARDEHDLNTFYLVFSPNYFAKAVDDCGGNRGGYLSGNKVRYLTTEKFQKWLGKSRRQDKNMVVKKEVVDIVNPNYN